MTTPSPDVPGAANTPRIFVSYHHDDQAIALRLADALRRLGADVWLELSNLQHGDFLRRVNEGFARSDWLVSVETGAALNSATVELEVNAAHNRVLFGQMRGILRFIADDHDQQRVPPLWRILPSFDATVDYDAAVAALLAAMRESYGRGADNAPQAAARAMGQLPGTRGALGSVQSMFDEALLLRERIADAFAAHDWQAVVDGSDLLLTDFASDITAGDLRMRGVSLLGLARPADAAEALGTAYNLDPSDLSSVRAYTQAMRQLGRHHEAEPLYRRALALALDDEMRLAILGEYVPSLQSLGRWEEALSHIDTALALRPYDLDWLQLRVVALTRLNRHNPTFVAWHDGLRATLDGADVSPDASRLLMTTYAIRAAYPDTPDSDDGDSVRQQMVEAIGRYESLIEGANIPPDLKPYILRARNALLSPWDEPPTVYLVVDLAAHMTGAPLACLQRAARAFAGACDLTSMAIGLIGYSDRVEVYQEATQNPRALDTAIGLLEAGATGAGNSEQPFTTLSRLFKGEQGPRYAIVVVAGVWAHSDYGADCARRCHEQGIRVFAVGMGGADRQFLSAIATAHVMSMFSGIADLPATLTTIAQSLAHS